MARTLAVFDNGMAARVTPLHGLDRALYSFGEDRVLAGAAYFGQPERQAVTISLGRPGDTSGYRLTGLHVGDWFLTGTVLCTGPDFTPGPHPGSPAYPLHGVTHEDAATNIASFLTELAQHCHGLLNP